jgi:hypothetical protein
MTIKRRIGALALAAGTLGVGACNDKAFLSEVPFDFVAPTNFYQTRQDAIAAVSGAYSALPGVYDRNLLMLVEFPTEMQTVYRDALDERSLLDNYSLTPSHSYLYRDWSVAYAAINRSNASIARIPAIDMDPALRGRLVGEAKFLRALHYFNLVRLFGGVPLQITEVTSLAGLQAPRNSAAEVYALIVQDLQDASAVLPAGSTYGSGDIGRASRGAAKTLLAKAYIQRAGTGVSSNAAADYQAALTLLRDVRANEGHSLLPVFGYLFDTKHEVNAEVIFDIQCMRSTGLGCHLSNDMAPRGSSYGSTPGGYFTAELPFFQEFRTADTRRAATWQITYVNTKNAIPNFDVPVAGASYGSDVPYMRKFLDSLTIGDDEPNYIILRYGDNLLLESEAVNELSGPTPEAYAGVNAVRQRAGIGNLAAGLSKSAFRDSVFHERRLELAMEGPNGYFDSQRNWSWASARVAASMALGKSTSFRTNRYPKAQVDIVDKFRLMPIPQHAIELDPLLTQNPGW